MRTVATFLRYPRFSSGQFYRHRDTPTGVVKWGLRLLIYLDDLLILFKRNGFTAGRVNLVRDILQNFGLQVNGKKSRWQPQAKFEHLGLWVDLAERKFDVPDRKRHRARAAATDIA